MKAFVVMWRTLKALYDEMFLFVWLSVLWWLGTVLLLPAAPVTLGLHRVANRKANYKRVDAHFFYDGARHAVGQGWLLYVLNLGVLAMLIVNIAFYLNQGTYWMQIVGIAWIWILLIALLMGQYIFPLFWQQDDSSLRLLMRNAFVLALQNPIYTILLFLFQLVLVAISAATILPILLLLPAALALTMNMGLVGILQELDLAPQPPPDYSG